MGSGYKCSNDSVFESFFNESVPKVVNLYLLDNFINILKYKNPLTKFFNKIENSLYADKYFVDDLNFNPWQLKTNDGLLLDNNVERISYSFQRKDEILFDRESENNIYMGYPFWLRNFNYYYERNYDKIQDFIIKMGGINTSLNIFFGYLNLFIWKYVSLINMKALLQSFINPEKIHYQKENIHEKIKDLKKETPNKGYNIKNNSYMDQFIPINSKNKKKDIKLKLI